MRDFKNAVVSLLRDTAIENDEVELAHLNQLSPVEQVEVGFVLRAARFHEKASNGGRNPKLEGVRSVSDALRFLNKADRDPHLR